MNKTLTIAGIEKQLADKLATDNANEVLCHGIHATIAKLIETKWATKKVNKRFITDFKAAYSAPNASVVLEYVAGLCYLRVWGVVGAESYDKSVRCFLGYADAVFRGNGDENRSRSHNYLTVEGFEYNDRCNGTDAAERITSRCRLLLNTEGKLTRLAAAIYAQKQADAEVTAILDDKDFSNAGSLPKELL